MKSDFIDVVLSFFLTYQKSIWISMIYYCNDFAEQKTGKI